MGPFKFFFPHYYEYSEGANEIDYLDDVLLSLNLTYRLKN